MNKTYLEIANEDYKYLLAQNTSGFNNQRAVLCQQICEKLLKHVLVERGDMCDLLRTHKLQRIYSAVSDEIRIDEKYMCALFMLSDFYIDARYPGDDWIDVSDDDMNTVLECTHALHAGVNAWVLNRAENISSGVTKLIEAANKL